MTRYAKPSERDTHVKYYRVHTEDIAYLTKQPRGLFTAVGKLVDAKLLSESEEKEYWKNREYFERILPVPPFYENGNPNGATTWFKDTAEGNRIFHEMSFYRRMAEKYGKKLFISECNEVPGKIIYEDEFQVAVIPDEKISVNTGELIWPIREISEENIEACVKVIRKSFETVAGQFGFTQENAPRFTAFATDERRIKWHLHGEHRPMFGYFKDEELIGYYSLLPNDKQECELNNLCVLPDYRHQGIGEELLLDAFVRARELGCTKMNIGIVEENQILRKWYEQYGFIHTGEEKYDFFPFTCGYMTRDLTR